MQSHPHPSSPEGCCWAHVEAVDEEQVQPAEAPYVQDVVCVGTSIEANIHVVQFSVKVRGSANCGFQSTEFETSPQRQGSRPMCNAYIGIRGKEAPVIALI